MAQRPISPLAIASWHPPGYTLVEMLIAILLIAVIAFSMFSTVLPVRQAGARFGQRQDAAMAASQLRDVLKNYVIAYDPTPTGPSSGEPHPNDLDLLDAALQGIIPGCGTPGSPCRRIPGDNPNRTWALQSNCGPRPDCPGNSQGCLHDGTQILPDSLRQLGTRMPYTVCQGADGGKGVMVNVIWSSAASS